MGMTTTAEGVAHKCDACGTTALRVVNGVVVIEHKHHGQKHTTVVTLAALLDMTKQPRL